MTTDCGLDEDDIVAGMSEPSADFFVLIQSNECYYNDNNYYYHY